MGKLEKEVKKPKKTTKKATKKTTKKGTKEIGRPNKEINKEQFELLCSKQCVMLEICEELDVTDKTLTNWCQRTYGKSFSEVYSLKRQKGYTSLRKKQFEVAMSGNPTMLIWLGRNWLDQKDRREEEQTVTTPIINFNIPREDNKNV